MCPCTHLTDFRFHSVKTIQPTGEETLSPYKNYSTKVKTLSHCASADFPLEALARCSQERHRLQTEPEVSLGPKEGKINPSYKHTMNFIRQRMLPPAA